jgi:hypothetical protein
MRNPTGADHYPPTGAHSRRPWAQPLQPHHHSCTRTLLRAQASCLQASCLQASCLQAAQHPDNSCREPSRSGLLETSRNPRFSMIGSVVALLLPALLSSLLPARRARVHSLLSCQPNKRRARLRRSPIQLYVKHCAMCVSLSLSKLSCSCPFWSSCRFEHCCVRRGECGSNEVRT